MAAVANLALTIWLCVPSRSSRVTPWLVDAYLMNYLMIFNTILAVSSRNVEARPLVQGNLWYSHFLCCLICALNWPYDPWLLWPLTCRARIQSIKKRLLQDINNECPLAEHVKLSSSLRFCACPMGPATGFTPCLLAESQPQRRMLAFYGSQELDYFD